MDETGLGPALKVRLLRRETTHSQPQILNSPRDLVRPMRVGHTSRKIRLVIADAQPLVRLGLRAMLAGEPDLSIKGEAGTLAEAVEKTERVRPDLLLLEYHLPDGSGADACRLLLKKNSRVRILIMSWDKRAAVFRDAMKAGAHAFVHKDVGQIELRRTIRQVVNSDSPLNPVAVNQTPRALRRKRTRNNRAGIGLLSPQQRRIFPLIAEGKTNHEIALELALAERTIKNYIADIFKKLKINRRTQAAAIFFRARSHTRFGKQEYEF